jgi:hypothetical protein
MKGNAMFHNTQAENYIHFAAMMMVLSQEHLEDLGGAKKIITIEGAQIVDHADDSGHEEAPGGHEHADCDYILYQFKDNSQIWYIRTPDECYLQLRGYYAGEWRHTEPTKARQTVIEKRRAGSPDIPAIWSEDVAMLELNVRAQNCLKGENIHYIGDLIACTAQQIRDIPRLGKGTFLGIEEAMKKNGLTFETDTSDWRKQHRV